MGNKNYKAFISYSHKDEKFGKWLHKGLEGYKIPKELYQDNPNLPKKLFPIFRDRDELSTSADLGREILKALHHSEYLIIICSINSAKSQWVNQEIIDFKAKHGEDKVNAIIIDGEPHAKDIDRFDDDLECFPEALKYKVIDGKLSDIPTEPIAGDFRKGKDGKEHGKLKLISGLLGVGFDELNPREEKRKRRNRFVFGAFITIFVSFISSVVVYIDMLPSSIDDILIKVEKLKSSIKDIDASTQENNKTIALVNQKIEELLIIKKEKDEILDKLDSFSLFGKEENEDKDEDTTDKDTIEPIEEKSAISEKVESKENYYVQSTNETIIENKRPNVKSKSHFDESKNLNKKKNEVSNVRLVQQLLNKPKSIQPKAYS